MGYDWNKNGKTDSFDRYIDYRLSSFNSKESSYSTFGNCSSKHNGNTDKNCISNETGETKNKKAQIIACLWLITIAAYIILFILVIKFYF